MSKTFRKVSPIRYRKVLSTIEKICVAANQDETNEVLNDIYTVVHPFVGDCGNPHWDWRAKQEKLKVELDEAGV